MAHPTNSGRTALTPEQVADRERRAADRARLIAAEASELVSSDEARLRLPHVLALAGCCKSSWWAKVQAGTAPKSLKAGPRFTYWRAGEVRAYLLSAN